MRSARDGRRAAAAARKPRSSVARSLVHRGQIRVRLRMLQRLRARFLGTGQGHRDSIRRSGGMRGQPDGHIELRVDRLNEVADRHANIEHDKVVSSGKRCARDDDAGTSTFSQFVGERLARVVVVGPRAGGRRVHGSPVPRRGLDPRSCCPPDCRSAVRRHGRVSGAGPRCARAIRCLSVVRSPGLRDGVPGQFDL